MRPLLQRLTQTAGWQVGFKICRYGRQHTGSVVWFHEVSKSGCGNESRAGCVGALWHELLSHTWRAGVVAGSRKMGTAPCLWGFSSQLGSLWPATGLPLPSHAVKSPNGVYKCIFLQKGLLTHMADTHLSRLGPSCVKCIVFPFKEFAASLTFIFCKEAF